MFKTWLKLRPVTSNINRLCPLAVNVQWQDNDNRRVEIPNVGGLDLLAKCVFGMSTSVLGIPAFKNAQKTIFWDNF